MQHVDSRIPATRLAAAIERVAPEWGGLAVTCDRSGVTRLHLTVYPPDMTPTVRMLVRARRRAAAPMFVLAIVGFVVLAQRYGAVTAAIVVTGACSTAALVAELAVGAAARRVREIFATDGSRAHLVEAIAASLLNADTDRARGVIDDREHRALWAWAYERAGGNASALPPHRTS